MDYIFDSIKKVESLINKKALLLFLDFDGTLAPIVSSPDKAHLSGRFKKLIGGLAECKDTKVAIISGREMKDLKKRVALKGIIYAGNHGFEIDGPNLSFATPMARGFKSAMNSMRELLKKHLRLIDGAIIEDKVFTTSVHYRMVKPEETLKVKNIFYKVVEPYILKKICRITAGKKVFEIRPNIKWDKGEAVTWLLARHKVFFGEDVVPVYIGDDNTDEDAFKKIAGRGIGIVVGNEPFSMARYYVDNVPEVYRFLNILSQMRTAPDR